MIKFSHAANLALHALSLMAKNQNRFFSASILGKIMGVSETHLSKVLNKLAASGILSSSRGSKGGFLLNKDPSSITLLNIIEEIDGEMKLKSCLLHKPICIKKSCVFIDLQNEFTLKLKKTLSNISLMQFIEQTGFEITL